MPRKTKEAGEDLVKAVASDTVKSTTRAKKSDATKTVSKKASIKKADNKDSISKDAKIASGKSKSEKANKSSSNKTANTVTKSKSSRTLATSSSKATPKTTDIKSTTKNTVSKKTTGKSTSSDKVDNVKKSVPTKSSSKKSTTSRKTTTESASSDEVVTAKKVTATKSATKKITSSKNTGKKSVASKNTRPKTASTKKATTKSSSKATSSRKKNSKNSENNLVSVLEYYDLPYRYNQTVVKILAQTPNILFVYWDISDVDRNNFKLYYGDNFFEVTRPVLIVHNETMNYSFEIEINDFANSWYLHVRDANCKYNLELGRRPLQYISNIQEPYIYVSSSNKLDTPNNHILFEKFNPSVAYKNVQNNSTFKKDFSNMVSFANMKKIYGIYDLYKQIYKDELFNEITNSEITNPSSGSSSSFK